MIGEISFCDQIGFNIKTDETKRYILDKLQQKYGLKIITKHFERYEERMLEGIKKRPHLLSVRTNGNPYYLLLTRLNFVNYCIFIDKKIQQGYSYPRMILSYFQFEDSLFDDTVLDGEMVKMNDGSWTFLLNDIVVLRGAHLTEQNLVKRINILYDVIGKGFRPDINDISKFAVKKFFKYDEALNIINNHINEVQYSCRGIYFRPLFLKFKDILLNFNDELITKVDRTKYKHMKSFIMNEDMDKLVDVDTMSVASASSDKSALSLSSKSSNKSSKSLDVPTHMINLEPLLQQSQSIRNENEKYFNTRKTNLPDVYEVLDQNMIPIGFSAVPSLKISKYLREAFKNKNIVDCVSVLYTFSTKFNKWTPIC